MEHPELLTRLFESAAAQGHPLELQHLIRFTVYAARLHDDILLVQPAPYLPSDRDVLPVLPPAIVAFLADVLSIPDVLVIELWEIVGSTSMNIQLDHLLNEQGMYECFGHSRGITMRSLYPPSHHCENKSCPHSGRITLKKAESRQCVLLTMTGAIPIWSIHLYCEGCNINYHHNFRVFKDKRTYYQGIPEVLQIGEHQFAEVKLINVWISMMLLSWTSATNCAHIYNSAFSSTGSLPNWQFNLSVTSSQIYDAFTILSLLEDCKTRMESLVAPHDGTLDECFKGLVQARNDRFRLASQPELLHYCSKCTRFLSDVNNDRLKVSVVVIDGVTVGHPCCGVPNCKLPLKNNHDRFCPDHTKMGDVCSVVGCLEHVVPGKRTCAYPSHASAEEFYIKRGHARFQLKDRLERARLAHPHDAIAQEVDSTAALVDDDDQEEEFDITETAMLQEAPVKVKAKFGRTRTHNEQLFVTPCGIIIARETFYFAEAVYSVVEMIKRTYRMPGTMPNHIFFDNNCQIARIVANDPDFENVGLTVDVFHFTCKHSQTDTFCQEHCNPAAYPELLGEGDKSWYFNSSIAEQTNAWLGGYHAICREMQVDRYNFFLDEMVRRRNLMTLDKLRKDGSAPNRWPFVA